MNYLKVNQILVIHDEIIEETDGSPGIRDIHLLESAAARPQASFGGVSPRRFPLTSRGNMVCYCYNKINDNPL